MISALMHRLKLADERLQSDSRVLADLQLVEFDPRYDCLGGGGGLGADDARLVAEFARRFDDRLARSVRRLDEIGSSVGRQAALLDAISRRRETTAPCPPRRSALLFSPPPQPLDRCWSNNNHDDCCCCPATVAPPSECPASSHRAAAAAPLANEVGVLKPTLRPCWSTGSELNFGEYRAVVGKPAAAVAVGGVANSERVQTHQLPEILFQALETEMKKREQVIQRMVTCIEALASKEQVRR